MFTLFLIFFYKKEWLIIESTDTNHTLSRSSFPQVRASVPYFV